MSDSACTPIAKSRQFRRLPLANSTNSTSISVDSTALKKSTSTAVDAAAIENNRGVDSNSNHDVNQFTPVSRAAPRPAVAASAPTNLKKNGKNLKNGSFSTDLCTPVGSAQRPMEIVSALTVDRVRAHFVTKSSPFGPLLPSPAGGRKYSQAALLMLKNSPLIHAATGDDVPVGPWSPGRVTRPARANVGSARADESVKNLSALFEASTIETKPLQVEQKEEQDDDEEEQQQQPVQPPTVDSPASPLTAECIEKRQKQIDITKQTPIYLAYVNRRSRAERVPSDPRTPRVTQRCSKRAWLGQLAKWRRDLHALSSTTSSTPSTPLKPLTLEMAATAREFSPAHDLAMPTS
jgi:hypothetical protein